MKNKSYLSIFPKGLPKTPSPYRLFFLAVLSLAVYGCSTVQLPKTRPLKEVKPMSKEELKAFQDYRLPTSEVSKVKSVYLPTSKIRMPRRGEKNNYGIVTTPELEKAYDTYLGGDVKAALTALKKAEETSSNKAFLWQISFLRAQMLIMMGRTADAEIELETTARLEIAAFGHNWNSRALRAETKIWLGDFDGAITDYAQIIKAIGSWRFPTSYGLPPSNIGNLVAITTAQLRAFTGLSCTYLLQGNYEKALYWAEEAEHGYNDLHYVCNHPLYGTIAKAYADSYYGRSMNLAFLSTARFVVTGDIKTSDQLFEKSNAILKAIGYVRGQVIVAALRALALFEKKEFEKADSQADKAITMAMENGFLDMVWRIEVVRGKNLFKQKLKSEAEAAFRRAQASIDAMSGALSTDRAKLRFGVGKEDVTYYLCKLDAEKKDFTTLFQDLERGRARAFVDMLAYQPVAVGRENETISMIHSLDDQIISQKLINMAPVGTNIKDIKAVTDLLKKRQSLLESLRERDSELADVLSVSTRKLSEIQARLKPGEVIAYALPARNNDNLQILLIKPSSVELKKLGISPNQLRGNLDDFINSIRYFNPKVSKQTISEKEMSASPQSKRGLKKIKSHKKMLTEETVVASLQKELKLDEWGATKTLYVVPSGDLYFVPWGILDITYPVAVLPTGGWLLRSPKSISSGNRVSIVGNPCFGGILPSLPGAEKEAIEVGRVYKDEPLLGKDATEKRLRDDIGSGVDILHLATHGIFYPKYPLKSSVFLSLNGKAMPLTAKNIFERPIPARLVVLSACQTGMGKSIAGDDLLGLVRSFYLGGTISTLSSLWPVEDEGTRLFMKKFHQHAASGNYGKAWLTARNHMKKLGFPPSVYGAFILGGSL